MILSTEAHRTLREGNLFLNRMKDTRIACFFKPCSEMPEHTVEAIADIIRGLNIDLAVSNVGAESGFLIVRQDMPVEKRALICDSIKLLAYNYPLWFVVEHTDGTTYTSPVVFD